MNRGPFVESPFLSRQLKEAARDTAAVGKEEPVKEFK